MNVRLSRIIPVNEKPIKEQIKYYEKKIEDIHKKQYLTITDFKTFEYCKYHLERLQKKVRE